MLQPIMFFTGSGRFNGAASLAARAFVALSLVAGCVPVRVERAATESEPAEETPLNTFVRVEEEQGRYWFTRNGERFLSLGVNAIVDRDRNPFTQTDSKYGFDGIGRFGGDYPAWADDVGHRMKDWGFTTLGGWCHPLLYERVPLYFTEVLWLGHWNVPGSDKDMRLVDVWSDEYRADVDRAAREGVSRHRDNPRLIGYFVNNELPWYGQHGWPTSDHVSLISRYLELPDPAPGRTRLLAFLRRHYASDFAAFAADWEAQAASFDELAAVSWISPRRAAHRRAVSAWTGEVAEEYFRLTAEAVRRYDPNHLLLGARFASRPYPPVMKACAKYSDVVSINYYRQSGVFEEEEMSAMAALCGKPVLITEFSWRAMENSSGCPNTRGAPVTVDTQQDRAERFRRYATTALRQPYLVGYHWFCYADQPPGGRFDGEDSNYGLVDTEDRPYEILLSAITEINHRAAEIHSAAVAPPSAPRFELLEPYREVTVRGGGRPLEKSLVIQAREASHVTWGDLGAGARVDASPAGDHLVLSSCPRGWGCGITFTPTSAPSNPDGSHNLLGATALAVRLRAPAGFRFSLGITESGAAPLGEQTYDGFGDADGESFRLPEQVADGEWRDYVLPLSSVSVHTGYGNQRGNCILDTEAIRDVDLLFPGGQPDSRVELEWVRVE